jgi:RND family efflux transporter MFP subunit
MTFRLLIRLLLAAVVVGAGAFFGFSYLRPVAVVTPVVRGTAVDAVPATVTVQVETRELRSDLSGRIAESSLELNKRVAKDDVLVRLDDTALRIEIERAESEIATTKKRIEIGLPISAELANARDQLAYVEEQYKRGAGTKADVDRQRRVVESLQMRVSLETVELQQRLATLENDLKLKQDQVNRMVLRSPIDGVVSRILARRDDLIGGGATVAEIIAHTRTVEARVSEDYFPGIHPGLEGTVRFRGWGEQKFHCVVSKVLPASDPQTQRYVLHLDVLIEQERLVPGITGEALIVLDQRPNAMVIPRSALLDRKVFVVADGRVQARTVVSGYVSLYDVEIKEGLRDGEWVIVDQLDRFQPGQRVRTELRGAEAKGGG